MSIKEYTSDLLVNPENGYRNITDLLEKRYAQAPNHIAFEIPERTPTGNISSWTPVTTADFRRQVRSLAKGIIAAGVPVGETLAVLSPTRYEWALIDNAALYAGTVVVPIYDSCSPHQIEQIVDDADIRYAVGGSEELCQKLEAAMNRVHGSGTVWSMDGAENFTSLKQLQQSALSMTDEELENRRLFAGLDDTATLVYTSGTTGTPKGAIITHRNFVGQVLNVAAAYSEVVHEQGRTIIFLPLAHVLARGLQMICLANGMRVAHLADPKELIGQLPAVQPTFLVVVPRVLEKIRDAVGAKAEKSGLGKLWSAALSTAIEYGKFLELKDSSGGTERKRLLKLRVAFFDALFYRKIRVLMGLHISWLLSGGAALDAELSLLFRGMGLPVIEGYGLTETTAPLCGNLPGNISSGTVGLPLPGATVRISDTGEVLAKGIGVFAGYRDETANVEAFDAEGFFRTGDLGELDDAGRLILRGRSKDHLVTAGGKSISPFVWETAMEKNPLVSHAVMVGDGRKFLSALVVVDIESTLEIPSAEIECQIQESVDAANLLVAHSEQVKKWTLVTADIDDPELVTPTQKLKRQVFVERWSDRVEEFYRS